MPADMRILIVDDSQVLREFIVQALGMQEGFITQEAVDGAEGVEMAIANPPDLILLDFEMPRLNGLQVVDALKEEGLEIPIILMTSHGSEAIAVEVFRKGVRDYLIKPYTAEEMLDAIEHALREVRLQQEKDALTQHLTAANKQLKERLRELDTLYQIGKSVTSLLSRDQLLERILDAAFYVTSAEEATLMMRDEESGRLRTELNRQRVDGELRELGSRSAEELAVEATIKGDATASGAMLYAPLKVGERVIGAFGVSNRVTARPLTGHDRRLLMALADYAAIAIENARLYEEIQAANLAKSEFVSFVAHELGAPMTSIRGYAEMIAKGAVGPLTEQQAHFVDIICSNVERMQVLVSDLQDISRIETGRVHLEIEVVQLVDVLKEALQATQGQMEARSQQLMVDVPERLIQVKADPARLMQILINLLSNAYKYTPEGGSICIRAWQSNGHVHCSVIDTGHGISSQDLELLFTKFFRSEDPNVRQERGTGLGLCITKNLVELQGGEIQVQSQVGQGTTFTFTIPAAY